YDRARVACGCPVGLDLAAVAGAADIGRPVRVLGGVACCLPVQLDPTHHPGHQVELRVLRYRLVYGAGEVLAFPGAVAVQQGRDDGDCHLVPGNVVGVPELRRDGRVLVAAAFIGVVTAIHHHAAKRQVDEVGCLVVSPGTDIAEGRDARGDQR